MNFKNCVKCRLEKEITKDNFQPSFDKKTNKIYFKNKCRLCENKSCKKYHLNNREKILLRKQNYDNLNIIKKSLYGKQYNQKIESKEKNAKRTLKRYHLNKNNPIFKLRATLSSKINKSLKRFFSKKNKNSIIKYLTYSIQELKDHLEKQFEPWMNWQNWGSYNYKKWNDNDKRTWVWNIDHIIPQSDLPYSSMEDENFKICWSLSNLRPLSAKQNILDGARRVRHIKFNSQIAPNLTINTDISITDLLLNL